MKGLKILLLVLCACVVTPSRGDDSYSHVVFMAVANSYWCRFGTPPRSLADFAKVTDINDDDPRITLDPERWLRAVEIVGVDEFTIRVERIRQYGGIPDVSTSSCK
jgi:hypothetical protein